MKLAQLEEFVRPYYDGKDVMHDLSHVKRFLRIAESLSKTYHTERQVVVLAAYFHGIDQRECRGELTRFLRSQGMNERQQKKVLLVASESQKDSEPRTIEGKILHDAHLVEGGRTFGVVKILVTGILRGSSLRQIADHFEHNLDRRFKCYLPETREMYSQKEEYTRDFFRSLKGSL